MNDDSPTGPANETRARHEHNLSQLRYFRSLSLRSKLEAVQGMADVIRHFAEMRKHGRFKSVIPTSGSAST